MADTAALEAAEPEAGRMSRLRRVLGVGLLAVGLGALAGAAASGGKASSIVALVVVFLVMGIWRRPQVGPMVLLLTGLLIEQFPIGLTNGATTVGVPITQSIPMFQGLGGLHLEPTDILPVAIFGIYLLRSAGRGGRWYPHTQLGCAVAAVFGVAVFAEVNGLAHHGVMRESLFECRPFMYLGAAYLATAVIVRTRSAVQATLWAIVCAEIFKSLQGIVVWLETRSWTPPPQNVLGHEEAMFFSLYMILVAALWLFEMRGPLRTVATRALPIVLLADLANDRRAAWLILGAGLLVVAAIGWRVLPQRRRRLGRVALATLLITAVYLPAYWNHTQGTLGKPADAIRSAFAPDPRDALSNEYRIDEDANLEFNIKQDGLLGAGFGRLIDYALPMPGLVTAGDAGITYVPHNSVLYILMRMGLLGGLAFWSMLGAGIIAGCRLARCPDRLFAVLGTVVAAMTVGWALEGATDMGFTFPRIAIVMGCLLGLLEAARHIHGAQHPRRRGRTTPVPTRTRPAHMDRKTPALALVD